MPVGGPRTSARRQLSRCSVEHRAHRHHGLRSGGVDPGQEPVVPGLRCRDHRPGALRIQAAGQHVRGQDRQRDGVRPGGPAARRHQGHLRLRRGLQRRQLQHPCRAGRPRDVRRRARRGTHLRPAPRHGLPAPGHPHGGDGALDRRPDHPAAHAPRRGAGIHRPQRQGRRRRGARGQAMGRQAHHRGRTPRRGAPGLPHPPWRRVHPRGGHRCCRTATWSTSRPRSTTCLASSASSGRPHRPSDRHTE